MPSDRAPASATVITRGTPHSPCLLRRAEKLKAPQAHALGVVDALADDLPGLIAQAFARVQALAGKPSVIAQGAVQLVPLEKIEASAANGQPLSKEIMDILEAAVRDAAAAPTLSEALDIGYRAFGASACTAAAREGIGAFQEGRKPDFSRTA